ncbi:UDP-glycosyltransferase 83A1 [Arabidopsis thaliana]
MDNNSNKRMGRPHVVVIPYPAQGHVLPLISFSRYLTKQGIQITFINTEFNHTRIINALPSSPHEDYVGDGINLVSIPDGLEDSPEERNIPGKLSESVLRFMPKKVEELIERMMAETSGGTIISCVVADQSLGWAIEVAAKFGIRRAAFCPAAAASMVLGFSIQKLIDDGLIDSDDWLDRQIPGSVIYVAFGSFGVMGNPQLEELAIGLELTKRPVLWVTGDQQPIKLGSDRVKVVRWAPQREVLSSGAIGCFVSHCGWNSTLEGAQNGIPFLCIPYFADQFINKAYICDVWKIGLGLERDARGVVLRLEVKKKIDEIMRDGGEYEERAMKVKEIVMKSVAKDGISCENLNKFVNWIKSQVN